ncbi:MAG: LamG domain-containing protein [Myxococcales bacterium]|nr:MAG: LamG domain-containing protein [Myxococcales bacterium]
MPLKAAGGLRGTLSSSKHLRKLLLTSTIGIAAMWGCADGEEDSPGPSGGSAGAAGATGNEGGSDDGGGADSGGSSATAGKGGTSSAGTSAQGGTGGSSTAGTTQGGTPGENGGEPGEVNGGAPGETAGAGGEAGGNTGPHTGPVLDYDFDAGLGLSILDSSGNLLNGALSVAAWSPQGRNGAAISLLGGLLPLTYVTVPAGPFKDANATTIAAWVKLSANDPWNRIFDFGGTGVGAATRFMYLTPNVGGGMRFSYFGGVPEREATLTTTTTLPLNVWKHVAVTIAPNGDQAIFVDGFPVAKGSSGLVIPPSELEPLGAASWLGKSRFEDPGFAGQMDEFKVYDRVLSAADIASLAFPKSDYTRITFDEGSGTTSDDHSDRGVDATLTAGTTWASGRLGAAAVLSGEEQYATLANPIAGCTDELTVALWVRHDAAGNWARIFDFGGTDDNFMYLTPSTTDGTLQLAIHHKAAEQRVISTTTIPPDGTWHHLAVTVSTAVARVFIDGADVGHVDDPLTPAQLGATNEHWLGKSRFPDPYFKGAFDEVRISCRAFTPDEIKNLAFR